VWGAAAGLGIPFVVGVVGLRGLVQRDRGKRHVACPGRISRRSARRLASGAGTEAPYFQGSLVDSRELGVVGCRLASQRCMGGSWHCPGRGSPGSSERVSAYLDVEVRSGSRGCLTSVWSRRTRVSQGLQGGRLRRRHTPRHPSPAAHTRAV